MGNKTSVRDIFERLSSSEILAEIERRQNNERDLKNAAFAIQKKKGLYDEFHKSLNDENPEK